MIKPKTDDLLIVEERTGGYPHKTFPTIYYENVPFAYECAIYHLLKVYRKDQNDNYIKIWDRKVDYNETKDN